MRKKILIAALSVIVLAAGFSVSALATHTSVTELITVPYNIGGQEGEVVITDTDVLDHFTVTETVTVTETSPPPPPPDTEAPTSPSNLSLSNVGETSLTVSWEASTDNVGVVNYRLFQGGTLLAEGENLLSYAVTGLTCGTQYTFGVEAVDAAGNTSVRAVVNGSTLNCAPPPSTSNCKVSNRANWTWDQCDYGTLIEVTNQAWECRQPLENYGPLPIKVVVHATSTFNVAGAVSTFNGCNGPGGDNVNLIVDIRGDGAKGTVGNGQDSFKTRGFSSSSPAGLVITGRMDCGPQAPNAHQDMIQFQGGRDLVFVNAVSGDYENGLSTCQGAGGVIFSTTMPNVDFYGGSFIACNHAILTGSSNHQGSSITDTKFRGGRVDGSDLNCVGFNSTSPCEINSSIVQTNVTCQRWSPSTSTWEDE